MSEVSARWELPLIVPGQAQKEMTHNEALAIVDLALHAAVVAAGVQEPPAAPELGESWIVGDAPTGAWSGHAHALAGWTAGGWRFVGPREGIRVWVQAEARSLRFHDGVWGGGVLAGDSLRIGGETILSTRAAAIPTPIGGTVIDEQARSALSAILLVLQHHRLIG